MASFTSIRIPRGRFYTSLSAILVIAFVLQQASAQSVKKWVDEEGVTHYSDQLPAGVETEVRNIEIPEASMSEFDSDDVNERLNKQLQELEQARKTREQEREAAERARDLEKAIERDPIVEREKKKKDRDRSYDGPYPKPLPGPFPEQYPRPRDVPKPAVPAPAPVNQDN